MLLMTYTPEFFFRLFLFGLALYTLGVNADMNWHAVNSIREDYFIMPHILMYLGILWMLLAFLFLKIKGISINYFVFVLFPVLSVFDEIWHRVFGVELATSPMMFWSPAHWLFGVVILYLIFESMRHKIESNLYIKTFLQVTFLILIWRFIRYLLVPLSPFSYYPELHSVYNILIVIFLYLFLVTLTKLTNNKHVFLPLVCLAAVSAAPGFNFITGDSNTYGGYQTLFFASLPVLFIGIFSLYNIKYYIFYGLYITNLVSFFVFINKSDLSWQYFIFVNLVTFGFAVLYFFAEEAIFAKLSKSSKFKKLTSLLEM